MSRTDVLSVAALVPPGAATLRDRRAPEPLAGELLLDLAAGLAAAERLWRPHAQHDAVVRRPVRLYAADRWEAWVIGWTAGQHVELHDHGGAAGSLIVVEGSLVDVRPRDGVLRRRHLPAGSCTGLPVGLVHDVIATSPDPATSIHVYSPPIESMTFYDADGARPLRTVAVADEAPVADLRSAARALHPSLHHG